MFTAIRISRLWCIALLVFLASWQLCAAQESHAWSPGRQGSSDMPTPLRRFESKASQAANSRGTDSRGTDSRGTDSRGTDSRGTDERLAGIHGQVWRSYDIRSYTSRMRDVDKPEQPIVDWILRETGTSTWFGGAKSVLSADPSRIAVYHTPAVQKTVQQTIDRFLNTRSEANEIAVHLITVNKPEWRVRMQGLLTPVKTQTPGIEAWLLSRENAALLIHELSQRSDFREHNTPNLTVNSGRTHTLVATRPRVFSSGLDPQSAFAKNANNYVDEGFRLQLSPLVSLDGQAIEAVVKCSVNQVERLNSVRSSGVDQFGLYRNQQIQIPQISSWQLHERFRWPKDEVLLISRGVVATPEQSTKWNEPLRRMVDSSGQRANALLFLESRSEVAPLAGRLREGRRTAAANYRGRY